MKIAKLFLAGGLLAASVTFAQADGGATTTVDKAGLAGKDIWGGHGAKLTPLALDSAGKPSAVLIRVPANSTAHDAHATGDGQVRMAFVLSGVLYYADGDKVDTAAEAAYGPGSMLLIQSGTKHWVSTRNEPLELLLMANPPERLTPPVTAQLGK